MAFDAGAIEATLTLNRNPFTAGLAAAKTQAANFARDKIEKEVTFKVDQRKLMEVEAQLKRISRQRVQATAKVLVERLQFDKLLTDLKIFDKKVYSAKVDVDTKSATAGVIAFRTLLASLNDQTVNLNANTRNFGSSASSGFGQGGSHFAKMASLIIATLPIIASAFTATVGAVGALGSAFIIAGLGAGAFALVAVPAFKKVKDAVAAGQAEIDKLPPGLREAGNAMRDLKKDYTDLQEATQKVVGLALASWFRAAAIAMNSLKPLIEASAAAFERAGYMAQSFFSSPWWQKFVQFLSGAIGPATDMLVRSIFALIGIVGNLTRAFWELGGSEIMGMITKGLEDFARWTTHIGNNKTFQAFMDAAVRSLPVVGALLGDLIVFIFKLAVGLEPLGTLIVRILDGIFAALNQLPVPVIQGIALAIAAVWAAMALGATGPVGLAIGVLAGLAAIFIHLAETNDKFKASIDTLMTKLRADFIPIWDTIVTNFNTKIKPAWDSLVDTVENRLVPSLQKFGTVLHDEVMPKIQPFVDMLTGQVIPAVLGFLETIAKVVSFLVDVFGPTVARELGSAVTVFQGAFQTIAGLLNVFTGVFTGDWTTFTTGIRQITEGFWTIIAGMFGTNLDGLRAKVQEWDNWIDNTWKTFWGTITGFFQSVWATIRDIFGGAFALLRGDTDTAATLIGRAFSRIANLFRDPINWVINTVINDGIIGAWNQVMGWIGVGGISGRVPGLPAFGGAFAGGGPVSGGIPGKDSVPILAQQGEYVLSVPAVNAMGGIGAVDAMHTAARGGSAGAFAQGGPIAKYATGGPVGPATTSVSMWSIFGGQVQSLLRGLGFGSSPMGGQIGAAISRIPGALVNKVIEAAQSKLSSIFQTIVTSVGGNVAGVGAVGGGGARAWIIAHESGGNPRAQNPTSSASGLYQMIDGTWKAYGGSTAHAKDASVAEQNAVADRYVAARYGSWENAQRFWQAHNYYDQGGVLPTGTTLTTNNTGQPEAILTQAQFRALTSSRSQGLSAADVIALINASIGGGTSRDTYNVMLPERATVRELADTIDFKRKVVSKGRYSR